MKSSLIIVATIGLVACGTQTSESNVLSSPGEFLAMGATSSGGLIAERPLLRCIDAQTKSLAIEVSKVFINEIPPILRFGKIPNDRHMTFGDWNRNFHGTVKKTRVAWTFDSDQFDLKVDLESSRVLGEWALHTSTIRLDDKTHTNSPTKMTSIKFLCRLIPTE